MVIVFGGFAPPTEEPMDKSVVGTQLTPTLPFVVSTTNVLSFTPSCSTRRAVVELVLMVVGREFVIKVDAKVAARVDAFI